MDLKYHKILGRDENHVSKKYSIQRIRELGYSYTNSWQLFIESCCSSEDSGLQVWKCYIFQQFYGKKKTPKLSQAQK